MQSFSTTSGTLIGTQAQQEIHRGAHSHLTRNVYGFGTDIVTLQLQVQGDSRPLRQGNFERLTRDVYELGAGSAKFTDIPR